MTSESLASGPDLLLYRRAASNGARQPAVGIRVGEPGRIAGTRGIDKVADTMPGPWHALVDEAARELYLTVLRTGGTVGTAEVDPSELGPLRRLVEVGLLVPASIGGSYAAVSPRAVTVRIGTEMRSEAVRLLVGSESVTDEFQDLIRAYDEVVPNTADRSATGDRVRGIQKIQHRISQLLSECESDLITVQPGYRLPATLNASLRQDVPFLQRGGTLRTIYQPSALSEPATVCYAAEVTKNGATVRVLDEPFQRTVILDRRIAVIPADEDDTEALFIEDPAMVAHLVRVFERDWARAESVRWANVRTVEQADQVGPRVSALLAQGLTQQGWPVGSA